MRRIESTLKPENNPVTKPFYRYFCCVFKKELPILSFHHRRTDTCKVCDEHNCLVSTNNTDSPKATI